MNKTRIEWAKNPDGTPGYTWNPITGCLNGCPYCYARKLAHGRLKPLYLGHPHVANESDQADKKVDQLFDPFYPRFWEERLDEIWDLARGKHLKARGIFVCDMGDLFGIGIPEKWTRDILKAIEHAKPHRFYLLTKQPQNLPREFPENCWVGLTLTDFNGATHKLADFLLVKATLKFLSLEPLLGRFPAMAVNRDWFQWLIIGQQTPVSARTEPKIEDLREIVEAADKAGIPVFLKDNLKPLLCSNVNGQDVIEAHNLWAFKEFKLRQEMPKTIDIPERMSEVKYDTGRIN